MDHITKSHQMAVKITASAKFEESVVYVPIVYSYFYIQYHTE